MCRMDHGAGLHARRLYLQCCSHGRVTAGIAFGLVTGTMGCSAPPLVCIERASAVHPHAVGRVERDAGRHDRVDAV